MAADENEQEHILGLESGEMMLLWQLHCPGMGQAVEITTGACTFRAHKQRDLIHRSRNVNSIHRQRTFPPATTAVACTVIHEEQGLSCLACSGFPDLCEQTRRQISMQQQADPLLLALSCSE
jgi:hypothetical protein